MKTREAPDKEISWQVVGVARNMRKKRCNTKREDLNKLKGKSLRK
jgi:hypothetical protein